MTALMLLMILMVNAGIYFIRKPIYLNRGHISPDAAACVPQ